MGIRLKPALIAAALAALALGAPAAVVRAAPAQTYYIPMPEEQVFAALSAIFPGAGPGACDVGRRREVEDPIITYVSIAAAVDGTVVVYDHWEDGYEPDIEHPVQPTTETWGDADGSNGIPPGFVADRFGVGRVIVLHNPVRVGTRAAVLDYDAGDKLAASIPVAVTRAAWASGTGTLLAGSVEVHDTAEWGRAYRAPVGEDVAGTAMFEHSALLVMAARDGTRVAVDADADGTPEISVTLDEGQSHHVAGGVRTGATVTASEPVQVDLVTGDVCATFQGRWFSLLPVERWSASAHTPVSTPREHRTTVHVFNPGPGAISIVRDTLAGRDPGLAVPAGGVTTFPVPDGSGARFVSADGSPFFAVGTVDTGGSDHEWGFALVPEPLLTPQALLGWGAGRDPGSSVNPGENGSPAWVTPLLPEGAAGPAAVCVDYDGDGRGALVDAAGGRYDRRLSLAALQRARVYDPDGDQTGMLLYACDGSGARLAVAWGQDPSRATAGEPGIDLGTTVPPLPSMVADKDVELVVDADGNGIAGPGETLRYTITVRNISRIPVAGLTVADRLPEHTDYVAGSTVVSDGGPPAQLPDSGLTPFPLDEGGGSLGTLPVGGVLTISFLVVIDDPLPDGVTSVVNQALVRSATEEIEVEAEIPVAPVEARPALSVRKTAAVEVGASAGTGTQGYWKNHPRAWPVGEIAVGGVLYPRAAAIAIMETPGRGDKTYDLFRQLAAARLNALAGALATCVEGTLAAADAWMAAHPPGSGVGAGERAWRDEAAGLHATLDEYNNGLLCAPHRDAGTAPSGLAAVTFTIVVTNTGNVDLTDVVVRDPAFPACGAALGALAARGGSATSTCRVEGVRGDLANLAIASGTAPGGIRVEARGEVFVDVPGAGMDGGGAGTGEPRGARPAGYWRMHPEAWPLLRLDVGGKSYTRDAARAVLRGCGRGDGACELFAELAATRLNLLQGNESSCVERAMGDAEAWLAAHPPEGPGSGVRTGWWKAGSRLRAVLERYNRGRLCVPAAR